MGAPIPVSLGSISCSHHRPAGHRVLAKPRGRHGIPAAPAPCWDLSLQRWAATSSCCSPASVQAEGLLCRGWWESFVLVLPSALGIVCICDTPCTHWKSSACLEESIAVPSASFPCSFSIFHSVLFLPILIPTPTIQLTSVCSTETSTSSVGWYWAALGSTGRHWCSCSPLHTGAETGLKEPHGGWGGHFCFVQMSRCCGMNVGSGDYNKQPEPMHKALRSVMPSDTKMIF